MRDPLPDEVLLFLLREWRQKGELEMPPEVIRQICRRLLALLEAIEVAGSPGRPRSESAKAARQVRILVAAGEPQAKARKYAEEQSKGRLTAEEIRRADNREKENLEKQRAKARLAAEQIRRKQKRA